jgi:hypothetical protein
VVCDGTQYYGYPKTAITNDYHGHDAPGVLFWWLSGFIFMKENNSKSTGILGIIFVRENNKKNHLHHLTCSLTSHFRLAGSLPEWFWAPHYSCMHQVSRAITHGNSNQQEPRAVGPAAWEKTPLTPVVHAQPPSLSFSLFTHVTCHPCFIKGMAGGLSMGYDSPLLLLGRSLFSLFFFFFNLEPDLALTLQRLGIKLPLSPICNPYYKSAQITQERKLDVGCYSPEARTSINPCVLPPFAQPSEARHTTRYKFTANGREPRQCVSVFT